MATVCFQDDFDQHTWFF